MAGLAIVVGAIVAVPPFVQFVRAGGWAEVRVRFVIAAVVTLGAAGGAVGLVLWAHHLAAVDRESGAWPYGAVFLTWAVVIAAALVAWTSAAVAAARRLAFSPRQLRRYAALAYVVGAAMVVATIATMAWWAVVGAHAPWFLHGTPTGQPSSMFDLPVAVTVAAMAVADAVALDGLRRIGPRPWALVPS